MKVKLSQFKKVLREEIQKIVKENPDMFKASKSIETPSLSDRNVQQGIKIDRNPKGGFHVTWPNGKKYIANNMQQAKEMA